MNAAEEWEGDGYHNCLTYDLLRRNNQGMG
jgi:hypothetical protein